MKSGYYIYNDLSKEWYNGRGGWTAYITEAFRFNTKAEASFSDGYAKAAYSYIVKVEIL